RASRSHAPRGNARAGRSAPRLRCQPRPGPTRDTERPRKRSHAERGNEGVRSLKVPSPGRPCLMPPVLRHAWLVWAVLLPPPASLPAAGPPPPPGARDRLLRFVPDDVGFCLVVQDLRAHAADLLASPFAAQFRRSAFGASLADSAEVRQLAKVEKDLEKLLGVGWAGLRDDVLGDAFVFAYTPGPPDKPELEQGLILVRARSAKTLAALLDKVNAAQKDSGELKALVEREHKGVKYYRRVERKEVNYYLLRGPVLVLTGQEGMLRKAIEREQAAPAA